MSVNLRGADLSGAHFWDSDLKGNELKQAQADAKRQIQSAGNWQDAHYDPAIRQLLGLPPEQPSPSPHP